MPPSGRPGLRLRAEDADDISVISACLQDALVSVRDLAYDREARNFVVMANRFRWESSGRPFERTLCALVFEAVDCVAYRGFRRSEEDRILSLLAIRSTSGADGTRIDLEFAGHAAVRLAVAGVSARFRDLGEPWPTRWQPGHELDGRT